MHPLKLIKIKKSFGFLPSNPQILVERVEPFFFLKNMFSWDTLLHSLVRTLAKSKAAARSGARGWQGSDQELGLIMGEIRRALSLDFVRAQALCLLTRLTYLGDGAGAATRRREQVALEEEERRRVQQAHFEAHVRGRGVPRAGEIFALL